MEEPSPPPLLSHDLSSLPFTPAGSILLLLLRLFIPIQYFSFTAPTHAQMIVKMKGHGSGSRPHPCGKTLPDIHLLCEPSHRGNLPFKPAEF